MEIDFTDLYNKLDLLINLDYLLVFNTFLIFLYNVVRNIFKRD